MLDWLKSWLNSILDWFVEWAEWIPKKLYSSAMSGVADFIHAIPHDPAAPDPEAWLNRLADVVGAPSATRTRIRAQAAAFSSAQWNWDLLADRYAACLTQLAGRRGLTPDAR